MPILVTCQCGKQYKFKDEVAGRRAKCLACGQVVQIPGIRLALPVDQRLPRASADKPSAPAM